MFEFCSPCSNFLARHRKGARLLVWVLVISAFFFWLGTVSSPVNSPGFCRIYY